MKRMQEWYLLVVRRFLGTMSKGSGGSIHSSEGNKESTSYQRNNAKEGCTLMVTIDMASSQLLMPQIIFTCKSLCFNMKDLIFKN